MSGLTPAQKEAKWIGERMVHNVKENEHAVKVASDTAWAKFEKHFPGADTSRFRTEASFDENGKFWASVVFITSNGTKEVFDERGVPLLSVYMTEAMEKALGLQSGFPLALTVNNAAKHHIPAVPFSESASQVQSVGGVLTKQKIWVTPTSFFNTDRDIFTHTKIEFTSGCEANKWLVGPNMCHWPQQLNFAVCCATTGCGVPAPPFRKRRRP